MPVIIYCGWIKVILIENFDGFEKDANSLNSRVFRVFSSSWINLISPKMITETFQTILLAINLLLFIEMKNNPCCLVDDYFKHKIVRGEGWYFITKTDEPTLGKIISLKKTVH
jgi:hypothetical protein